MFILLSFGISDITMPVTVHGLFLLIPLQDHWFPFEDFSLDIPLSSKRLNWKLLWNPLVDPSIKQVSNLSVLSNFHSLIHSFNQHSLSTSYVPGSVLGTEDPNTKKAQENKPWTQRPSQSCRDIEEEGKLVLEVHGQYYSKQESVTDFLSQKKKKQLQQGGHVWVGSSIEWGFARWRNSRRDSRFRQRDGHKYTTKCKTDS